MIEKEFRETEEKRNQYEVLKEREKGQRSTVRQRRIQHEILKVRKREPEKNKEKEREMQRRTKERKGRIQYEILIVKKRGREKEKNFADSAKYPGLHLDKRLRLEISY